MSPTPGGAPAERLPRGALPRTARVRKRAEFRRAQAEGRRFNTEHFTLLFHAPPGARGRVEARLGLTVTRRAGNSVLRNRLKRLLREAFRATRELWHPEIDVLFFVRTPPAEARLQGVVRELVAARSGLARRTAEALRDRDRRDAEGRSA